MLLHVPNQKYKRLKIKNGQNDRSGNSSVNLVFFIEVCMLVLLADCDSSQKKEKTLANSLPITKLEIVSIIPEIVLTLQDNRNKVRFQLKY